jgi:hypothetical protein
LLQVDTGTTCTPAALGIGPRRAAHESSPFHPLASIYSIPYIRTRAHWRKARSQGWCRRKAHSQLSAGIKPAVGAGVKPVVSGGVKPVIGGGEKPVGGGVKPVVGGGVKPAVGAELMLF